MQSGFSGFDNRWIAVIELSCLLLSYVVLMLSISITEASLMLIILIIKVCTLTVSRQFRNTGIQSVKMAVFLISNHFFACILLTSYLKDEKYIGR